MAIGPSLSYFDTALAFVIASPCAAFIYFYGWLYGLIFAVIYNQMWNLFYKYVLKCNRALSADEDFWNTKHGDSNPIRFGFDEKWTSTEEFLQEKFRKIKREPRLSSTVYKFCGHKLWKPVKDMDALQA
jgi:hypothetical protein